MTAAQTAFIEACQTLLGSNLQSIEEALEGIEHLLTANGTRQQRVTKANGILQAFLDAEPSGPYAPQLVGLLQVGLLQDRSNKPLEPAACHTEWPHRIDDPAWTDWIRRYDGGNANPDDIRAFGDCFSDRLSTALPTQPTKRKPMLMETKPRLLQLQEKLEHGLSWSANERIKDWLKQIHKFECEDRILAVLSDLEQLANTRAWATLTHRLYAVQTEVAPCIWLSEHLTRLSAFQGQSDAWQTWNLKFDETVAVLENFQVNDSVLLPWPTKLTPDALTTVLQGLVSWSDPEQKSRLNEALRNLAVNLQTLLTTWPKDANPLERLATVQQAWEQAWGRGGDADSTPAPNWADVRQCLEAEAHRFFLAWRKRTLQHYAGGLLPPSPTPRTEADESCLCSLRKEAAQLEALESKIDALRPYTMDEASVEALQTQLDELKKCWGRAPLHQRLTANLQDKKQTWEEWVRRQEVIGAALKQGEWAAFEEDTADLSDANLAQLERFKKGREKLATWRQQATSLSAEPFEKSAKAVAALLTPPASPDGDELCEPDKKTWNAAKNRMVDCVMRGAQELLDSLNRQAPPYPLLASDTVSQTQRACQDLDQCLRIPALHTEGGQWLLPKVKRLDTILNVHALLNRLAWQEAADAIDRSTPAVTELHDRQRLRAALDYAQMTHDGNSDADAWLTFYAKHPMLLADSIEKSHYLDCLRSATALGRGDWEKIHLDTLRHAIQDEPWLRGLLLLATDRADEALPLLRTSPPKPADWPATERLLGALLNPDRVVSRVVLEALWQALSAEAKQAVWSDQQTPLDSHQQRFAARQETVRARLGDTGHAPDRLKKEYEQACEAWGYTPDEPLSDALRRLECLGTWMADFDHNDPWGLEKEILLHQAHTECETVMLARHCNARQWTQNIQTRLRGIRAWKDLDQHWKEFRADFDRLSLPGNLNPEGWPRFIEALEAWCGRLEDITQRIDFGLPGAGGSTRWLRFRELWRNSPEGQLAQANTTADRLSDIADAYRRAWAQTRDFAQLHQRLLDSCRGRNRTAASDAAMDELHALVPLTEPVRVLRQRLADPNAGHGVGYHYQQ